MLTMTLDFGKIIYAMHRLEGVMFSPVFVCLSVYLFVNSITLNVVGGFSRNFREWVDYGLPL